MILAAKYTNQGGRPVNEDSCDIFSKQNSICAVVADGLGGHGGGEIASSMAVEMAGMFFEAQDSIESSDLYTWFQKINEKVCGAQTDACRMKTTLTLLLADMEKKKSFWAHVGDSRIYHFKDGVMSSVTVDHSVSQMAVFAGEITFEQIRHHEDRSRLLRAIGSQDEVNAEISGECDISTGNHAFLLCSDGFWEYVYEAEMEETLRSSQNPVQWLEQMSLMIQSRVDGTNDNNTAVAVWIVNGDES